MEPANTLHHSLFSMKMKEIKETAEYVKSSELLN